MRRRLRSLLATLTVLGLALAWLGAVTAVCADEAAAAVAPAPGTPAPHDCDGEPAPPAPASPHDCTMFLSSCAPQPLACETPPVATRPAGSHAVPRAQDEARPHDAVRGPATPPPRA